MRQKLLDSVTAARECSAQIQPSLCEYYVRPWREDSAAGSRHQGDSEAVLGHGRLSWLVLASAAGGATSEGGNRGASAAANAQPGPDKLHRSASRRRRDRC